MERDVLIPPTGGRRGRGAAGGWARSLVGACCAFYLTILATLAVWAIVPILAGGRLPVVIVSGSMRPAIEVGDLVIGAPHDGDALDQGQVVTFRDPGRDRLVTHRIVEVLDNGRYRTRGDANRDADPAPITAADVDHVPKLLVPMAGLPLLWASTGQYPFLAGWALATLAAIRVVSTSGYRPRHLRVPERRPVPRLAAGTVAVVVIAATTFAMRSADAAFTGQQTNSDNSLTATTVVAPTGLSANCLLGTVTLEWTAASGATGYEIRRSKDGGAFSVLGTTSTTSYGDTSLALSSTYDYRVFTLAGSWTSETYASASSTVSLVCL